MIDLDDWALRRAQAFAAILVPAARRSFDPRSADAWEALARRSEAAGESSRGPSAFLLAGPFEAVARALRTGDDVPAAVCSVYGEGEEVWSIAHGGRDTPAFEAAEGRRQKRDAVLLAALAAATPPPRTDGALWTLLLDRLGPDLGRTQVSREDPAPRLGEKLLRRAGALTDDPVRQARVDLGWTVLVPLALWPDPVRCDRANRVFQLFKDGLPPGFAEPPPPPTGLAAVELLWPIVRRTQLPEWRGLRFDLPEVRACLRATGARRDALRAGLAQLRRDPGGWGLEAPEALLQGIAALEERLVPARPARVASGERVARPARVDRAALQAESDGLRGGPLLWPLVALVQQPDWISWRSDLPVCIALMKAKQDYAPHVKAGMEQLLERPEAFGVVDPGRQLALRRTLQAFRIKRQRWLDRG